MGCIQFPQAPGKNVHFPFLSDLGAHVLGWVLITEVFFTVCFVFSNVRTCSKLMNVIKCLFVYLYTKIVNEL